MPPDLFGHAAERDAVHQPLAERMRPRSLRDVIGQVALLGETGPLTRLLRRRAALSCLFVGPPGSGKTTLGRLCADEMQAEFVALSAVSAGIAEIRQAADGARVRRDHQRQRTLLFVDEIHRFHRGQQDALLPHVESGLFTLVGATTENPRFSLTRALLSRCRVFDLVPLADEEIAQLCDRALRDTERGLGHQRLTLATEALGTLIALAEGDARRALGVLESAAHLAQEEQSSVITSRIVAMLLEKKLLAHDRAGESHYDVASALIKSMRASDARAAAYYLARMVEGGESLDFILRRLVIFASEDVGLADPHALPLITACCQSVERVGLPEAWFPLLHGALYLARAPKSRSTVRAREEATRWVEEFGALAPPPHLLHATSHAKSRQESEISPGADNSDCLPIELARALRSKEKHPGP